MSENVAQREMSRDELIAEMNKQRQRAEAAEQALADAVRERDELTERNAELLGLLRQAGETLDHRYFGCNDSSCELCNLKGIINAALAAGR